MVVRLACIAALSAGLFGCGGALGSKLATFTLTSTGSGITDSTLILMPENTYYTFGSATACRDDRTQAWCLASTTSDRKQVTAYTEQGDSPFRVYIENDDLLASRTYRLEIALHGRSVYSEDVVVEANSAREVGTLHSYGFSKALSP